MIDWKGELEAVHTDGRVVPVELAKDVPQPDNEGDYMLTEPLEAGKFVRYFREDGTQRWGFGDNIRPWTIRNRQQWGAEIPVNGVRPAWLQDDEWRDVVFIMGFKVQENSSDRMANMSDWQWERCTAIRLPANHWVYRVLRWNAEHPDQVPFEPFGGADTAPTDWDEGEVLLRSYGWPLDGHRVTCWRHGLRVNDIIGYRKRVAEDPRFATAPVDADEALVANIRTRVSELNELLAQAAKRSIRTKISTTELSLVFGGGRETPARIIVDLSKVL